MAPSFVTKRASRRYESRSPRTSSANAWSPASSVLRVPEDRRQLARHLRLGVAEHRLRRPVRGEDAAVPVEEHDRGRSRGEHRPEALLALAQQRHRRERAVSEGERGDQDRQDPRVEHRERADRDPEPGEDELHREAGRGEEPALAKAVAAAEPQHHGQEQVVDRDEHDCGGQPRGGEAVVAVDPDEIGGEPGRQGAQQVVGDVEQPDVPGVAIADPLRHDDREHERDEQRRRRARARRRRRTRAPHGGWCCGRLRRGKAVRGPRAAAESPPPTTRRSRGRPRSARRRRRRVRAPRSTPRRWTQKGAAGVPAGTASLPDPPLLGRSSAAAPRQGNGGRVGPD